MTKKRRFTLGRLTAMAVAAGLLFVLVGDRGSAATPVGIDPLEILDLQVKPNIIILLDSSGSMRESPAGGNGVAGTINFQDLSGDFSGGKLFQAKTVLRSVVANNQAKASFLFGQYTQRGSTFQNTGAGANRFNYTTQSWVVSPGPPATYGGPSPSMATTELTLLWQPFVIGNNSNTLYYVEGTVTCAVTLPAGTYGTAAELSTLAGNIQSAMNGCTGRAATVNTYTVTPPASTSGTFRITRASGSKNFSIVVSGTNEAANSIGFTATTTLGAGPFTSTAQASRGFQAFQDIQTGWNTLYFQESGQSQCAVTVPPGTYASGAALAAAMQAAMNGCSSRANLYDVTYNPSTFRFTFTRRSGANSFTLQWATIVGSIRAALGAGTANQGAGTGPFTTSGTPPLLLHRTNASICTGGPPCTPSGDTATETFDPDGTGPVGVTTVKTYRMWAGKVWNGQTLNVLSDGTLCGTGASTGPATDPGDASGKVPVVNLQQLSGCSGTPVGSAVQFIWGGGIWSGNSISCNGFQTSVPLVPCDQGSNQSTNISPYLQRELPTDPVSGNLKNYTESTDGAFSVVAPFPPAGPTAGGGGQVADGSTPIAASIGNIKTLFNTLWNTGIAPVTAISTHNNPKEKTVLLFVTDGNDTCAGGTQAQNSLAAAYRAQLLYQPIVGGVNIDGTLTSASDPASSVTTYMVGYGQGASATLLNYIAWGGSGLGPQMPNNGTTWTANPTQAQRNACVTCTDAFLAPDPQTLADTIQKIVDQGASSGEFTSQRTATAGVYEMVGLITNPPLVPGLNLPFNPFDPQTRYAGLVPVLFQSTFTLPLFQGQLKAFISDNTSTPVLQWNAGQSLTNLVNNGMTAQCPANATAGTAVGQCLFSQLTAGATDSTIGSSTAAIKRRIYTTSQNGAFTPTIDQLLTNQSPFRLTLWPPDGFVDPASGPGSVDDALGLTGLTFAQLQTTYLACKGTVGGVQVTVAGAMTPPHPCSQAATQLATAQQEARRRILAYTAGAQILPAANGDPTRVQAGANKGQVLFVGRPWALAESTLGSPGVVPPPIPLSPGPPFGAEYNNYAFGPRDSVSPPNNTGGTAAILQGFGLTFPDAAVFDYKTPGRVANTFNPAANHDLQPIMTVVYVGANDMLHAFRAGGCNGSCDNSQRTYAASDTGGEELWGFVPYDQLGKLALRMLDYPQKRDPHDYMLASGLRFSDVFVPGTFTATVPDLQTPVQGVWRRMLFFGRGIGGKYVTALDITGTGPFTLPALNSKAPIVVWSRGNPDTSKGVLGGTDNNALNPNDKTAYSRMGQTWSVPAVAFVPPQVTSRNPAGAQFVLFMGSGYGDTSTEGTTFYTLDALTGDVIAAPDVSAFAPARSPAPSYPNALVADAVDFNPAELTYGTGHPFSTQADRVYIGDLYGHLWKIKVSDLNTPILFGDLGGDQPVGAPVGVFMDQTTKAKYVYVTTGDDSRAFGPFKYFAFLDDDGTTPATPIYSNFFADAQTATPPAEPNNFRGTSQPLTALNATNQGRVFFIGTRFNPLGTQFAPAVPPYPCRSSFDSVLFALGALSGQAAYDFATSIGSPSDAYAILKDSRKTGVQEMAPPGSTGKGKVTLDEGLSKGPPEPPPYRGIQPTATTSGTTYYVGPYAPGAGVPPAASMRYVPTVCQ